MKPINIRRYGVASGFTLIELLVALTIFAIMSVLSYRTLSSVLKTREHLNEQNARLRNVALFFSRIDNDFASLLNRPIRGVVDREEPPISIASSATGLYDVQLALTRSGYASMDGIRLSPQRVGYRLREGRIEWIGWPHLDTAPRSEPQVFATISPIRDFRVRALDRNGNWHEQWPVLAEESRPIALEIALTLNNGDRIERLFALRRL